MRSIKELLEQRNAAKKKMPHFTRQDVQKAIRIRGGWRHPEGMHSKMRLKLRGNRRQPSIGFSSPKAVRGFSPQGYKMILIHSPEQISSKDPITIASTVGLKKRLEIARKAKEKNIIITNIKDITAFIQKIETQLKERKESKKAKAMTKEQKKKEIEKKAAEKEKAAKEKTKEELEEERINKEKEEKKKVLAQGN